MKISVIIPVYNVETYLRECLDSVISQTYEDWEAIMVDDCSTDNSRSICEEYLAQDNRFKLIRHSENRGLSSSRNSGLEASTGRTVCFVDSDDCIAADFLETMTSCMQKSDADIVSCVMGNRLDRIHSIYKGREESSCLALEKILYQESDIYTPSVCGKIFRKELFDNCHFREGIYYEDLDITARIYSRDLRCIHLASVLYHYRVNPQSITHTFIPKRSDVLDVTEKIEEEMSRCHPRLLPAASDRALSAAFNILGLMAANNYRDVKLESRCIDMIKKRRLQSLLNPKVRLKNKMGILITYLAGFSGYKKIARHIYRH